MGTALGALKAASARTGIPVEEIVRRMNVGRKRCWMCQRTLPLEWFHWDRSRKDGRTVACKTCRNRRARELHVPRNLRTSNG